MNRRLRRDLPFRRLAIVVAGGGALGAYETGVLRALGRAGVRPAIVAGASAGALNAVAWVAAGLRTEKLEEVWRRLDPATIGMRWNTLAWRAFGMFLTAFGAFELFLAIAGSPELSLASWLQGQGIASGRGSALLDALAWVLVAAGGVMIIRRSDDTTREGKGFDWLGLLGPDRLELILVGWGALHLIAWTVGLPWPHRFSATLFGVALGFWLLAKPGRVGSWARGLFYHLLPESKGRGFWGDEARRRLVEQLVAAGAAQRLVSGDPIVILTGLALDTGRVAMFIAGAEPSESFRARADACLAEAVHLRSPKQVVDASVASSAIPMFFEPSTVRGRKFIDAVALSTHPLRAALFAEADAALVIVVAPSGAPPRMHEVTSMAAVWGRYLDVANWRDFQQELAALPAEWQEGTPRRLCIVEPNEPLPGGVLAYVPGSADGLMDRGEEDAWRALGHAGWLEA